MLSALYKFSSITRKFDLKFLFAIFPRRSKKYVSRDIYRRMQIHVLSLTPSPMKARVYLPYQRALKCQGSQGYGRVTPIFADIGRFRKWFVIAIRGNKPREGSLLSSRTISIVRYFSGVIFLRSNLMAAFREGKLTDNEP